MNCQGPIYLIFILAFSLLMHVDAIAQNSVEYNKLIAQGKFGEVVTMLESNESKLKPIDRFPLCYSLAHARLFSRLYECLDKLEKELRTADDRRSRLFTLEDMTASVFLIRAEAALDLGDWKDAAKQAALSAAWIEKEKSPEPDVLVRATLYEGLAAVYLGDAARAAVLTERLRKQSVSGMSGDFSLEEIKTLALARLLFAQKRYAEVVQLADSPSIAKFMRGLFELLSVHGPSTWAQTPLSLFKAISLAKLGKLTDADKLMTTLAQMDAAKQSWDLNWVLAYEHGKVTEQLLQPERSVQLLSKAVELIEVQRAGIGDDTGKLGYAGTRQEAYTATVAALNAQGNVNAAFEVAEKAKSRALLDLIALRYARKIDASSATSAAPTYAMVSPQLTALASQANTNQSALGLAEQTQRAQAAFQLRAVSGMIVNAVCTPSVAAPIIRSKISIATLAAADLGSVLKPEEALVSYFSHEDKWWAFVFAEGRLTSHPIEMKNVDTLLREFRAQLQLFRDEPKVQLQATALYETLIAPFKARLEQKNLLIVPHGLLHYLPFAALHDGTDYLGAVKRMRVLPSASVGGQIQRLELMFNDSQKLSESPALVMGDPTLDLKGAEVEAKNVASLFRTNAYLKRAATKGALLSNLSQAKYFHFAGHGEFLSDSPQSVRLLLAGAGPNEVVDYLYVQDIISLNLKLRLAILSACETGLGNVLGGDEVEGISRGFLAAGTANLITSLWKVDDTATQAMMTHLYAKLESGASVSEALSDARRLTRKDFPHPGYWAAFVLTGSGE
jgi:CHAT domain-containing protein